MLRFANNQSQHNAIPVLPMTSQLLQNSSSNSSGSSSPTNSNYQFNLLAPILTSSSSSSNSMVSHLKASQHQIPNSLKFAPSSASSLSSLSSTASSQSIPITSPISPQLSSPYSASPPLFYVQTTSHQQQQQQHYIMHSSPPLNSLVLSMQQPTTTTTTDATNIPNHVKYVESQGNLVTFNYTNNNSSLSISSSANEVTLSHLMMPKAVQKLINSSSASVSSSNQSGNSNSPVSFENYFSFCFLNFQKPFWVFRL